MIRAWTPLSGMPPPNNRSITPPDLAQVATLKRLFYSQDDEADQSEEGASEALKLGQHLNVPLARWSVAFLPHQQARVANHEKLRLRD